MCNSVSFDKRSCFNHHRNLDTEQTFPHKCFALLCTHTGPLTSPQAATAFYHCARGFSRVVWACTNVVRSLCWFVLSPGTRALFPRLARVDVRIRSSSCYCWTAFAPGGIVPGLSLLPQVDTLGFFPAGAITKISSVNICVQVFAGRGIFIDLEQTLRSGIAGSDAECVFNFILKKLLDCFLKFCIISHSRPQCT